MTDEERIAQAIEEAVKAAGEVQLLVLSNGAVLRPRALPDLMVQKLMKQFPKQPPPMVRIEQGGKTWEEPNPNDPKYIEYLEQRQLDVGDAFLDLTVLVGFDILRLPKRIRPFEEDEDWEEELEAVGIEVPENRVAKRILWTRYRILQQASDLERLRAAVERLSGVEEEEVETAQEGFRRETGRRSGRGVGEKQTG